VGLAPVVLERVVLELEELEEPAVLELEEPAVLEGRVLAVLEARVLEKDSCNGNCNGICLRCIRCFRYHNQPEDILQLSSTVHHR
jgi:hypothetical protein